MVVVIACCVLRVRTKCTLESNHCQHLARATDTRISLKHTISWASTQRRMESGGDPKLSDRLMARGWPHRLVHGTSSQRLVLLASNYAEPCGILSGGLCTLSLDASLLSSSLAAKLREFQNQLHLLGFPRVIMDERVEQQGPI